MNTLMLVGKIKEIKKENIVVEIKRNYKNSNGVYEEDNIPVKLWAGVHDTIIEQCKIGYLVGIRGRLEIHKNNVVVIAEKISFIPKKEEEDK